MSRKLLILKGLLKFLKYLLISLVLLLLVLFTAFTIEGPPFHDNRQDGAVLKVRPADGMKMPLVNQFVIYIYLKAAGIFGFWEYPMHTDGKFEHMKLKEKVYWLYKAQVHPIENPEKGSGLRSYFIHNSPAISSFPRDFVPTDTLRFSAAGDLLPNKLIASSTGIYTEIADVLFLDLSLANLESPVMERAENKFEISAEKSPLLYLNMAQFNVLKGYGEKHFTVMQMANNHALDFGEEGVESSLKAMRENDISPLGVNLESNSGSGALILDVNGIKTGIASATFGLNGKSFPEVKPELINVADMNNPTGKGDITVLEKQIEWCKSAGCDIIIASLHWGLEFEFFPRKTEVGLAHQLADMGVDVIVGHHPHVIQPVEYYHPGAYPGKVVPVFYSLGNLTSPVSMPAAALSGIANVSFVKGVAGTDTLTLVSAVDFVPVIQVEEKREGENVVLIRKLEDCELPACEEAHKITKTMLN